MWTLLFLNRPSLRMCLCPDACMHGTCSRPINQCHKDDKPTSSIDDIKT